LVIKFPLQKKQRKIIKEREVIFGVTRNSIFEYGTLSITEWYTYQWISPQESVFKLDKCGYPWVRHWQRWGAKRWGQCTDRGEGTLAAG